MKTHTNVTAFSFESSCQIRTIIRNGDPWFVAADVCAALKLSNPTKSVAALDDDEKALTSIQGLSRGNEQANIISESGLYFLTIRCRDAVKPGTLPHRFRKWVTSEVLPQIRTTGFYVTAAQNEPSQEEKDAYNIGVLVEFLGFITEAWQCQIEPALRAVESPIAGRLHDRFKDAKIFASFVDRSLKNKLKPGQVPRIM
jgi:prophage antirepressor-like protein